MTQSYEPDRCCGKHIARALQKGTLTEEMDKWECPVCGCEWQAQIIGEVKHWSPNPAIAVLRI